MTKFRLGFVRVILVIQFILGIAVLAAGHVELNHMRPFSTFQVDYPRISREVDEDFPARNDSQAHLILEIDHKFMALYEAGLALGELLKASGTGLFALSFLAFVMTFKVGINGDTNRSHAASGTTIAT